MKTDNTIVNKSKAFAAKRRKHRCKREGSDTRKCIMHDA